MDFWKSWTLELEFLEREAQDRFDSSHKFSALVKNGHKIPTLIDKNHFEDDQKTNFLLITP